MKRALPSYEDLLEEGEEGEIREELIVNFSSNEFSDDDDDEMGLKAVLPVGKFDEKFKEGQVPESGEQYLCTVRSQRKKLENIVSVVGVEGEKGGVSVDVLVKKFVVDKRIEIDKKWAENFCECLEKSEKEFHAELDSQEKIDCEDFNFTVKEWYQKLYETAEIQADMRILRMLRDSQEICEKLLNLHCKWLKEGSENQLEMDSEEDLNKVVTWLQALVMCRDSRLTSAEIANLRQIAVALMDHGDRIEIKEVVLAIVKKYGQIDLVIYK